MRRRASRRHGILAGGGQNHQDRSTCRAACCSSGLRGRLLSLRYAAHATARSGLLRTAIRWPNERRPMVRCLGALARTVGPGRRGPSTAARSARDPGRTRPDRHRATGGPSAYDHGARPRSRPDPHRARLPGGLASSGHRSGGGRPRCRGRCRLARSEQLGEPRRARRGQPCRHCSLVSNRSGRSNVERAWRNDGPDHRGRVRCACCAGHSVPRRRNEQAGRPAGCGWSCA